MIKTERLKIEGRSVENAYNASPVSLTAATLPLPHPMAEQGSTPLMNGGTRNADLPARCLIGKSPITPGRFGIENGYAVALLGAWREIVY
jgi:hypothetical protein